jgi:hypothetical protein
MSNIPTLERIVYWANLLVIFALALSLFAGAASIIFGLWLNTAKDEQAGREKRISGENIAGLTAETEIAKKERAETDLKAEQARERAAEADKRAQKLEGDNLKLRTDLENATAEARSKQTELTREQQEMAKEQQKTADAQKDAAQTLLQAQFNLQQIRSLQMPRHLVSGENREKFMQALKGKSATAIDIKWAADMFIGEPKQFAEEIADALKEAGWTITKLQGVIIMNDTINPLNVKIPAGLKIFVRDLDNIPSSAQALHWAFLSSGFVADLNRNKKLEGDAIGLMVFMIPVDGGRVLRLSPK